MNFKDELHIWSVSYELENGLSVAMEVAMTELRKKLATMKEEPSFASYAAEQNRLLKNITPAVTSQNMYFN